MPKLLVIADDLSGATDVGVQFARQGVPAFVVIHFKRRAPLAELFGEFEVLVANVESRHVSSVDARLAIATLVGEARAAGVDFFYKKTDSTLRGNVGAELDALLKATGQRTLCFVPGHPALGRTTRDGVQFVHGKPLNQTAYANDARNPLSESRVAAFLEREAKAPISLVRQTELAAFSATPADGIVIFDAETEADVANAAHAIRNASCLNVLAGPAALASFLPGSIPFNRTVPAQVPIPRQFLIINGSLNEVAFRQCLEMEKRGAEWLLMPPAAVLSEDADGHEARQKIVTEAVSVLSARRNVVLGSVKRSFELTKFNELGQRIFAAEKDWPDRIALNTGRIVAEILSRSRSGEAGATNFALCVIGGDTLAGVAKANGWKGLLPRDEIERGLAACEIPERPGLILITKPGGFGNDCVFAEWQPSAAA